MPAPQSAQEITHYENFPVASWLCPPHLRPAIAAIYWFARTADDLADEGDATPQQRLDDLAAFRNDLMAASKGQSASTRWPQVFTPLAAAIAKFSLPINHLDDLLSAFEQDIRKTRDGQGYANESELHDYCARSANPVGRLLLRLYGINDEVALGYSDNICTALQLINFWQDISQDIPRGRFYLSDAACAQFNVTRADLNNLKQTKNTTDLIATQAVNTLAMMQKGSQLVHLIPGRAGWELRFVVQGGLRILDKIKALDYAMLEKRPKLTKLDYVVIGWRALWM
ncbi:MAG: squalene synthase HpnC [Burkholderiaceae bacterium]